MDQTTGLTVDAGALHRLVYNLLLFDTKSTKAFLYSPGSGLFCNTSDGHVYIEDQSQAYTHVHGSEVTWLVKGADLKAMEVWLRKAEGQVKMNIGDVWWLTADRPEGNPLHNNLEFPVSFKEWVAQSDLFSYKNHELSNGPFAINPDRLRKLALLQPRDYPVDFKLRSYFDGDDWQREILLFKKGPFLRGVYGTLDRDILGESGDDHLW